MCWCLSIIELKNAGWNIEIHQNNSVYVYRKRNLSLRTASQTTRLQLIKNESAMTDTKPELTIFLLRNLKFGWATIRPVASKWNAPTTNLDEPVRNLQNKVNLMINSLENVPHPTASTCYLCWTTVAGNNSLWKMYVYVRCFVQRYRTHYVIKMLTLWTWQRELLCLSMYVCVYIYIGCPRRNGQNFGRVFLMLKYTDITQNTYIQSWTVTEITTREVWKYDSCYTLIDYQIRIKTGRNVWFL